MAARIIGSSLLSLSLLAAASPAFAEIELIPAEEQEGSFCAFQDPAPAPCPHTEVVADFRTLPIGIQVDDEFTADGVTFSGPNVTFDASVPDMQQTFVLTLGEAGLFRLRLDFDPPVSRVAFPGISHPFFPVGPFHFLQVFVNDDQALFVPPIPTGSGFSFLPGALRETGSAATIDSVELTLTDLLVGDSLPFFLANRVVLVPGSPPPSNEPPVAAILIEPAAGSFEPFAPGDGVRLDGSGSSDADGDLLTFEWTVTYPGGQSTLSGETAEFMPVATGTHAVSLEVSDGTDSDTALTSFQVIPLADKAVNLLNALAASVSALPSSSFSKKNAKGALLGRLTSDGSGDGLGDLLASGDYARALEKIANLIKDVDGCAANGVADAKDVIQDCAAQEAVHAALLELQAVLQRLLG